MDGASGSEFTGLIGWVTDVVATLGPWGVAFLLALDNTVPVIPSEAVLPFAGYLSAADRMPFWLTWAAATAAATASAYVYYEAGRRLGPQRARAALCRLPLTDEDDVDRARAWFERHGQSAVFTGRFLPLVRSFVSLPAGTEGLPRVRYGVLTAAGSGLWNLLWLAIGRLIGQNWEDAGRYSDWFNASVAVVAVGLVARYLWRRRDRLAPGR